MKKKALLNFSASAAYQLINLLVGLVLPKYYTERYGSAYNGLNQSVLQIMGLLGVLQFGISAASIQRMFQYIAGGNQSMIASTYQHAGRQYRKMGRVFIAILLPISALFPLLLGDELPYQTIALFLLIRGASSAMEYFFHAKYSIVLIAHNQSYLLYLINIVLLFLSAALHLAALLTNQNILRYQSVALISSVIRMAIVSFYIHHRYPFLSQKAAPAAGASARHQRADVLISEIAGLIIDSTDMLVLGLSAGLVSVSVYSVYHFVVSGILNILGSCREAVFAGIGQAYHSNFDRFKKGMDRFESIYLTIAFYLYCTAMVLFSPFIQVYTANMDANYVFPSLPALFIATRLIINLRVPSIVAINAAGHFKQVKRSAINEAAINLIASVLLVRPLGIHGVLLGSVLGAAYRTPWLIGYANQSILKRSSSRYWKKALIRMPLLLLCYILSIACPMRPPTLWRWFVSAILVAAMMAAAFILWLRQYDPPTFFELKSLLVKARNKSAKP